VDPSLEEREEEKIIGTPFLGTKAVPRSDASRPGSWFLGRGAELARREERIHPPGELDK